MNLENLKIDLIFLLIFFGALLLRSLIAESKQKEELKRLSEELEKANEHLRKLDQAKSEFLSVASHQLRTPITAIKGYSSMFLEGDLGELNAEQQKSIQNIFEVSERMSILVSDLLDLSKIESGTREFAFGPVNICEIIEELMEEFAPRSKQKGLYLYFDNVNRACPEIRADADKIRQVITNLVDNAIKYTSHGGVTIRTIKHGESLICSVIDTGMGVDPKDKDRLFQKFFRSEEAGKIVKDGSGLGTYVASKIMEAHNGKIWFESEGVNKGTSFHILFPIPKGPIKEERVIIQAL